MDEISVHVGRKENVRITASKEDEFLRIRGYHCEKDCEDCSMHRVGEDLENLDIFCETLRNAEPVVNMKVAFHISEKITFI